MKNLINASEASNYTELRTHQGRNLEILLDAGYAISKLYIEHLATTLTECDEYIIRTDVKNDFQHVGIYNGKIEYAYVA